MAENLNVYAAEPMATGTVFAAPLGTSAPTKTEFTSGDFTLDAAFLDLGHIGEDGYTENLERNIEKKRNFGGKVVKVLQTEFTATYEFVLLETLSANVLKAVYGDNNVTVTAATTTSGAIIEVKKNSRKLPHLMWVIDTTDTELEANYRNFIPDAQITNLGEVKIVHTDTIEYTVTLEAFDDATGNNIYTWINDGRKTGP